jgi:hypothetical protein
MGITNLILLILITLSCIFVSSTFCGGYSGNLPGYMLLSEDAQHALLTKYNAEAEDYQGNVDSTCADGSCYEWSR